MTELDAISCTGPIVSPLVHRRTVLVVQVSLISLSSWSELADGADTKAEVLWAEGGEVGVLASASSVY